MNDWPSPYDTWKTATPPEYSGEGASPKPVVRRTCACGNTFDVRYDDQAWCEFRRCRLVRR